jgi:hypothetical protein
MSRPPLRLVPRPAEPKVLTHRNRRGQVYYLHQGVTKKGAPKYFFAKTVGPGALADMPAGYELAESVNGVVSVRRATDSVIPETDVQFVREALAKVPHLARHVVERKGEAIIVHEPEGGASVDDLGGLAREMGVSRQRLEAFTQRPPKRYTPVMKFEPESAGKPGEYVASRMTYRGDGGWRSLSTGPLSLLVPRLVPHIGRESFFELL